MCACMHQYIYVHVCACIFVCMYVCMYIYIYIYICMYVHHTYPVLSLTLLHIIKDLVSSSPAASSHFCD